MALDADKILADLKAAAKPELEKRAEELRTMFLTNVDEFVDSSRIHFLDNLLKEAAEYEIQAIMSDDAETARQYATAAEDTLLAKLNWYRLGGEVSERQWRDVLGVLAVQAGRLESEYLFRMAEELGVADLLARALAEAG